MHGPTIVKLVMICFKTLTQQSKNKQGLRKITEKLSEDLNRNRHQGKYSGLAISKVNRVGDGRRENKASTPHTQGEKGR